MIIGRGKETDKCDVEISPHPACLLIIHKTA